MHMSIQPTASRSRGAEATARRRRRRNKRQSGIEGGIHSTVACIRRLESKPNQPQYMVRSLGDSSGARLWMTAAPTPSPSATPHAALETAGRFPAREAAAAQKCKCSNWDMDARNRRASAECKSLARNQAASCKGRLAMCTRIACIKRLSIQPGVGGLTGKALEER